MPIKKSKPAWKVGLPMYANTASTQHYYVEFLQHFVLALRDLGFNDEIEIVTQFPDDLHQWWRNTNVLLTQTCGYPYITSLRDQVHLIATPCFDVPGCLGPLYSSVFITHDGHAWQSLAEAENSRVAINQADSNSGMNVLRAQIMRLRAGNNLHTRFFSQVQYSQSHINSMALVQQKKLDLAAIDCVTFAYVKRYAPELCEGIRIIDFSQQTYGLPYIASSVLALETKALLFKALKNTLSNHPSLGQHLLITDYVQSNLNDYLPIEQLKTLAFEQQYFELSTL